MSFDPESLKRRVIELTPVATVGTPSSTIHLPKKIGLRRKPLHKMKAYSDDFINDTGSYAPSEPAKKIGLRRKKIESNPIDEYAKLLEDSSITKLKLISRILNKESKSEDPDDYFTIRIKKDSTIEEILHEIKRASPSKSAKQRVLEELK